jgi:DNA-directed RNA polymerase delta subunit
MKLKTINKEELETMSFDDLAYVILKEKGKKMKTADIFGTIKELLQMSDAEYEARIADFFTLLATEKRFIQLDKGFWDLRENHTAKIEIEDVEDEDEELENEIIEETETEEDDIFLDESKEIDDDETEDELKDFVVLDEENEGDL